MTAVRILDDAPEATDAGTAKAMLGEARANVVWAHATAPEAFFAAPEVADLIWRLGDLAAELRGRLAERTG